MEEKRKQQEHKDMQDCLRVRMREVHKCEQARMENQMRCQRMQACAEVDEAKRMQEMEMRRREEQMRADRCAAANRANQQSAAGGYEAAKRKLEEAQAEIRKYES